MNFSKARMPWREFKEDIFIKDIVKVRKSLNLTSQEMKGVFEFITNDSFWRENAISPSSLMIKGKNGLRKIDNILIRMKSAIMANNQVLLAEEKMQYEPVVENEWNPFTEL
jgi:hypothetical protein